ncbi:hypothetical protein GMORB2_6856 [Geosmithia morbida]|uniref:Uncharacterized protein n=1 Tax=Geosmithia morbida TaxID=1094350 RepID=A0A9P5D6A1_9HYPO|nr:uncharacterized protein GMORB2_6856 [Geosmithia morbida]KAF4123304.1 hypothetical protein GMORB2_6856 [Geosmithia morbida]
MPPSSKRSQRRRRETSDATAPPTEEETTPTRPAKRRRKLSEHELPDTELPANGGDDALVTQVTQHLKSHPVQASRDHANSIHEANGDGVQAFAKVAAQDWTFYITKLAINIGRAPEGAAPDTVAGGKRPERRRDGDRALSEDVGDEEFGEESVHIDLGPSKTVSREHAMISYDSKNERWLLTVKGRNGVRVDNRALKPSESHQLSSGEVLEVGGVEMMFVLPSELSPLHINSTFLERCGLNAATTPVSRRPLRQHAHTRSPSDDLKRPGTPPPPPSTQSRNGLDSMASPAFSTPGPVMVGANGADLSKDENKHIKPQYSYAQMITQAITSVPDGKLTLNGIYTYITDNYAYYRHQTPSGWQNSIRHNLSLNKNFEKVPRSTYEPGKGAKWQIVAEVREELINNAWRIGRGGHRGSSAPSSPNKLNYITQGPRDMASRGSPSSRKRRSSILSPPPRSSLPMSQSTPDGPLRHSSRANAVLTADGSPLPRAKKSDAADPSFSSFNPQSPTLTSSYLQDEGGSFITPAPPRVNPRLAPPSTAQRPSQHMPTSSPAPFWRFFDIGSTPLRPPGGGELGTSPFKPSAPMPVESSSPVPGSGRGNKSLPSSPTRGTQDDDDDATPKRERHENDDDGDVNVREETATADGGQSDKEDNELEGDKPSQPQPQPRPRQHHQPPPPPPEDDEDDDDQGFDLAKGFQSIGAYHEPAGKGISVANAFGSH